MKTIRFGLVRSLFLKLPPLAAGCLALAGPTNAGVVSQGVYSLYSFTGADDGANPEGALIQAGNGSLYGTTYAGGSNGYGAVYQISSNGAFTPLYSFTGADDGAYPEGGLVQAGNGCLYGTTYEGGSNSYGTVYQISTNGAFTPLFSFSYTNGGYPEAGLIQAGNGYLYGTTYEGGTNGGYGTVYQISTGGAFTPLFSFSYTNGGYPEAGLIQAGNGALYGTTYEGGSNGYGTVYQISTNGAFTSLYSFNYDSGGYPEGGLIQAGNGHLYGTTYEGGSNFYYGTVYQISTDGAFSSLFSFGYGNGGSYPETALVQSGDGNLYGTTYQGGAGGDGTVYQISTNGVLNTLYSLTDGDDGSNPKGALLQAGDGNLYGTAYAGGASNYGAVFVLDALQISPRKPVPALLYGGANPITEQTITLSNLGALSLEWSLANTSSWLTLSVSNGAVAPGGSTALTVSVAAASSLQPGFYPAVLDFTNLADGVVQSYPVNLQVLLAPLPPFASFPANDGADPYSPLIRASDGYLYGTTVNGGLNGDGTVYQISTNGALIILYGFTGGNDGANSYAGLMQARDGYLYATTANGGIYGYGTVFQTDTNGVLNTVYSFTGGNDGGNSYAGVIQGSDGSLYGTTSAYGASGYGTVFRINTEGTFSNLYSFTGGNDGGNPDAGLIQASDGNLYGTTSGGAFYGTIFRITTNGALTTIYPFTGADDGAYPEAGLVQASDGNLYGTASAGGVIGLGTVFRVSTSGAFDALFSFNDTDGSTPVAGLVQGADGALYGTTSTGTGHTASGTAFRVTTNGAFNSIHLFTGGSDGGSPQAGLIQLSDGNLYGTASAGGFGSDGTVFKVSTNDAFTLLHAFVITGPVDSSGGLQLSGGDLYGTTAKGGTNGQGSVFQVTSNGTLTTIYSFSGGNGGSVSGLILAGDGCFYGTTYGGGKYGDGTLYQISSTGVFTPLFLFNSENGADPEGVLVQAGDGYLYGTTASGGSNGYGTVYQISTNGAFTPLFSFNYSDGGDPEAGLIQAGDGYLYGTTYEGGSNGYGTVYQISTNGAFNSLYSFTDGYDGSYPAAGLIQAGNGYLYGTTSSGGSNGYGTVYQISTNGAFNALYSFTGRYDGSNPTAGLVQAGNGYLYGTTPSGGVSGQGTVFQISLDGAFTPLYSFSGGEDGGDPAGSLVEFGNYLYGVTQEGGPNGNGTVFRIPISQASVPPVTIGPASFSGGDLIFSVPTTLNQSYTVQQTTNLATAGWFVYTNFPGTGLAVELVIPTTNHSAFFRVVEP
jgi:uncharacterized repeat protein (TIGR03803 family)